MIKPKRNPTKKYAGTATSILMALGVTAPPAALSQGNEGGAALEEIMVTARKTNESIQDIPLSVQAFTAETIMKQQIIDVEDVAQFTAGLHSSNNVGSKNNPSLRFRGIDTSNNRTQQTSSAFMDGVYIPGLSTWVSMNDIERVEVVKGPQSAFFGRSTFSGAINFITKTPGNEFAADVQAIVGDAGRMDLWLSAEGPIIKDKLSARGSVRYYTFDGAWDNTGPGGGSLGGQETQAWNVTLYATPTEDLSIKLRHVDSAEDDGVAPVFLIDSPVNNCGPFGTGTRNYYCGTLSSGQIQELAVDTRPPTAGRAAELGTGLGMDRDVEMTTMNIDWDIGGSGYLLSSVTGRYESFLSEYRPLTGGVPAVLDLYSEWTDESFSQELRLTSPQDQRFRWMIGAYYLEIDQWVDALSGFPSTGPEGAFSLGQERGDAGVFGAPTPPFPPEAIENTAIFGSVAFDITDKLTVSLELRREEETLDTTTSFIQEAPPLDSSTDELAIATARPFGGAEVQGQGEWTATLPRFIVDYTLSDDTMLYASYSEGNNPGVLNPEVIQLEPTVALPAFQALTGADYEVDQAELISYEIGGKHTFASGRGFLNGAVYFMEWNNQVFRSFEVGDSNGDGRFVQGSDRLGGGIDFQKNGSSEIYGFELAGGYAITENWYLSGNYNYNKTEIQDLEDSAQAAVFGDPQAAGNPIPRSPEHTAALALDFTMPASSMFGQEGEWFGRWDAWYQSESTTWVIGLAETEKAWLHNLRGGWRNDRYSVTAWIENVLDDDPVLAAQRTTVFTTFQYGYGLTLPQPRTVGITVSASFGQ
jgi:iron complex outermembrane receptor protein